MKLIFLDIDGVLCTLRGKLSIGAGLPNRTKHHHDYLDPVACALVLQLIKEFDAKVVISSTWRFHGIDYIKLAFEAANHHEIIGAIHDNWSTPRIDSIRGDEIAKHLYGHNDVTHYLILDDDSDMRPEQKNHLVLTNGYNGISAGDYLKARIVLGAADSHPDSDHLFKWN